MEVTRLEGNTDTSRMRLRVAMKDEVGQSTKLGGYDYALSMNLKQHSRRTVANRSLSVTKDTKLANIRGCNIIHRFRSLF